jgi:septal ring factor EnvC (AmiA/AmiB activator)
MKGVRSLRPGCGAVVALSLAWSAALVPTISPAATTVSPVAKEAELKQVRTRIESIRKTIQEDAERRDALSVELKGAELEIQSAREELGAIRARRLAAEARLRSLKAERAATQAKVAAQREALAGELRAAYMNGRQEHMKMLLNQSEPSLLERMMIYYGYFGRARAERISEIDEHLAHLDLLADNITAETDELRALEADNARQVGKLAGARDRRAITLAKVQDQIRSHSDELAKLESDARALEKLLEELRRAIEDFPQLAEQPFQGIKGKLPWPVKGPLLARFGQLRAGGPLKWQGVLISSARGTQVRAPFYGRVVYADWLPGLGLLIVLDHGGGYMSLYGHNEQLYRKVGERVAPGDALSAVGEIAGMGKTGLYLEIRKGRQVLNPAEWLGRS